MSQLTLETILDSKIYVNDKGGVQFQSPRAYIEPFLEAVQHLNPKYSVAVSTGSTNKNTDGTVNESFARVRVEAKLPGLEVEEHDSVLGLVYGLDTAKPTMKIYSGRNAWACLNLAIFNAEHLHTVELTAGISSVYEKARIYSAQVTAHVEQFRNRIIAMRQQEYDLTQIDTTIGALLRKAIANKAVGTTPITMAAQSLFDKNNVYAIRDNKTTQWNIYSAVTQYITDKVDIMDKASKTLYVSNMFETLNK